MNEDMMKRIGRQMGIRMGLLMSFALSILGPLSSGHLTIPAFVVSFVISTVISIIIGILIPIGRVSDNACTKMNIAPESLKGRLLQALISDLIYTPIMTLIMVAFAYMTIVKGGAETAPPFIFMYLRSFIICMIAAYILILIFMPLFLKQIMKKEGIPSER